MKKSRRDRHELFAMPDGIQVTDYAELVSRPGDFATLRQKNKDGMYTALEQFEAMALLDQAKLVFMSLKSNQMFSESELAAWRQRHADQLQQPITPEGREGGGRGPSRHTAAPPLQPAAATPRKRSAAETKKQENASTGGNGSTPGSQKGRQRGARESKATPPGKKARKAATAGFNGGAGPVATRRLTYIDEAAADRGWRAIAATPVFQGRHVTLSDGAATPEGRPSSDQQAAAPECKLETDEVLKLFVLMGTPAAFLRRAKKMFGYDEPEESAAKEGQSTKVDDARERAGTATAAETGHGKKSSASAPSAAACGPFAPPKLVPGRLGFGQFAASSARPFKLKSKPSASNASGKKKVS
ncbi:unnamed protein product [Miscanthus lutarioriparius]|uniref:Uncharacterized protein n=1 Tax=Miscanthus lutarioriparius TaxID=422564 RepID=A0A811MK67_9POAL|nr:unnamed protein product [Miscanthus lutarioriparius]